MIAAANRDPDPTEADHHAEWIGGAYRLATSP
jgi:hypothetical protein